MNTEYSLEAKNRIQKSTFEDLFNFIQIIPKEKLEVLIKSLPKVKGFRSGKDTDIRLKRYFGRSESWEDKDWVLMLNLWYTHSLYNMPIMNALKINNIEDLGKITEDSISSKKIRKEIVEKLIEASHSENLSQIMIENWIFFSPFPKDSNIDKLIKLMPKENTFELKEKLISLENTLKVMKNDFVEQNQIHLINKNINKINTDLSTYTVQLNNLQKDFTKESEKVSKHGSEIGQFIENTDTLKIEIKSLNTKLTKGLENFKSVNKDLTTINEIVKAHSVNIEQSETFFKDFKEELVNLKNKTEEFEKLIVSYRDESKVIGNIHSTKSNDYNVNNINQINNNNSFVIENYKEPLAGEIVTLNSMNETVVHLEKNLNYLGIKLPHAKKVAKEVVAALSSGQVVSLCGSLSELVAKRFASCLTGGEYKKIKIPFGCTDSIQFDKIISSLLAECNSSDKPLAIILEGINRSAFELYGNSLKQLIIQRNYQLGVDSRSLFIFTTILEGPSTLPVGSEILELGPTINVNSIKWLDRVSSKESLGIIPSSIFYGEFSFPDIEYDWDESILPDWLSSIAGPYWRKMLLNADTYGRYLGSSSDSFLEFTIFAWVIPMIIFLESDKINDFIEYIEKDDRLHYFFMKYSTEAIIK